MEPIQIENSVCAKYAHTAPKWKTLLDLAEIQASCGQTMHMHDWTARLDAFLQFTESNILTHMWKISHEMAKERAEGEFEKFQNRERVIEAEEVTSDFGRFVEEMKRLDGRDE
jgi:hypothetical protein